MYLLAGARRSSEFGRDGRRAVVLMFPLRKTACLSESISESTIVQTGSLNCLITANKGITSRGLAYHKLTMCTAVYRPVSIVLFWLSHC